MKKGLVLEGGAMRGLFTVGILDALMENGFVFDGAVGVSAGAVFGCNIKSGQIGRALRYNLAFCRDKRYCGFHSLVTTGNYYNADFCYRTIPHTLDWFDVEAFRNNPMDFYVVATHAVTGDAVYHNCLSGDDGDIDWLRASASMPLVSKPVVIDKEKEGSIYVLRPEHKLSVKRTDRNPQSLLAVYMEGRQLAQRKLTDLKEYFS